MLQIEISVKQDLKESEITVSECDNEGRNEKELGYIRFNRTIKPSERVIIGKFAELFAYIYNAE